MILLLLAVSLVSLTIINQTASQQCSEIYQQYCANHSACLIPNSKCKIMASFPTPEQIDQIIKLHNSKRSSVATGQTKLSPASNMFELEWDKELADIAQSYANQCIYAHDKPNCRKVRNFNVGQNIAIQKLSGVQKAPYPDWNFAVNAWFDEIQYFSQSMICSMQPPAQSSEEYRHFTQLVWGNTFRLGCGYVLYKEDDFTFTRLYVCNYGPGGNIYDTCVYNPGNPCTGCPLNFCCGRGCSDYAGLCRRTKNEPPRYPPPRPHLFYCDFQSNDDCDNFNANSNWIVEPTLGGNHLGIELNGGNNSTIVFQKTIKPTKPKFCVSIKYRKGPKNFSDPMSNTATEVVYIPAQRYTFNQPLPSYDDPATQQMFSTYNLTLSWGMETQLKISFDVPKGVPTQFLNVDSILAIDGECQNTI